MPIFNFTCLNCNKKFEKFCLYSKIKEVTCPFCNSKKIKREWQNSVSLIFKGNGFYKTDYKKDKQKNS